mmetsp:Transcript_37031/g.42242  ORF Transcript_37031/g.42242 Transcript_37031/m.42242 type:complete len:556 (+) Transcript_37031:136-1803(+)
MKNSKQLVMILAAARVASIRGFSSSSSSNVPASSILRRSSSSFFRLFSSSTDTTTTKDGAAVVANGSRLSRGDLSLDIRTVTNELDIITSHLKSRRASEETIEAARRVAEIQSQRVALIKERDGHLNKRKEASARVGQIMRQRGQNQGDDDEDDDNELLEKAKEESTKATELADEAEAKLSELESEQNTMIAGIPNLLDDRVPDGEDESQNDVVSTWGSPDDLPRELEWDDSFVPKWHDDVALNVGGYLAEEAVRMSGSRFVALSGDVARLERALGMYFLDRHTEGGYTEVSVPYIVSRQALEGTSQLPKFQEDLFAITPQSHTCNGQDAFLIPTAEVPVTNLHAGGDPLEESDLPLKYVAYTPCFRAEAGSYGRDTKGLIRTHQFNKVELVKITTPETSDAEHEQLTEDAENCLRALKLPYRKVRLCSGDVGFAARHCYDLEVWLPGAQEYREISSCSNTGDFQARRMALRYRPAPVKKETNNNEDNNKKNKKKKAKKPKPVFCHTINGSGLAVGRTLVAILENYQKPDGTIVIPEVLRPYMGGREVISPPSSK